MAWSAAGPRRLARYSSPGVLRAIRNAVAFVGFGSAVVSRPSAPARVSESLRTTASLDPLRMSDKRQADAHGRPDRHDRARAYRVGKRAWFSPLRRISQPWLNCQQLARMRPRELTGGGCRFERLR